MPMKSVYVKDEDLPIWDSAQKAHGKSMSSLITQLLKKHMEERMPTAAESAEMTKITVTTREENSAPLIKQVFTGRWLITPQRAVVPVSDDPGVSYANGLRYALAVTKKGAVAVYEFGDDPEGCADLLVYDDFEDIEGAELEMGRPLYPTNVLAAFAEVLNADFVVELDI